MINGSIGERVAAYRRRRGLSQATLAALVGRSESWLSQVERGIRSVDRLSVLLDLAEVLHVDVGALIGRPWRLAPNGDHAEQALEGVRRFFTRYASLLDATATAGVELPTLRERTAALHGDYQSARYRDVVIHLPELLADADTVTRTAGADRHEALLAHVAAYAVAAKLLTKVGAVDLALLAADRMATAAVDADSLPAQGLAAYQVTCALLKADRGEDAERLAVTMAEQVTSRARSDSPTLVSVAGALWLIAAVIAARRTDRGEAWQRLDRAETLADLLGEDGNHAWTAFGPTNVAIHRVSVAAELGDPGEALALATGVDPSRMPPVLKSRRAQIHLDLAWAQAQRKRDAEATLHLLEAERAAPEAVRYNVIVRELVREMLVRGNRRRTSALHDLAVRAGVLD